MTHEWRSEIERLERINHLILFAQDNIGKMMNGNRFCFQTDKKGNAAGASLRYAIISLIGMRKAEKNGYILPHNTFALYNAVIKKAEKQLLDPGDLGLLLWLDARFGGKHSDTVFHRIESFFRNTNDLSRCLGMEIAWIIIGASYWFKQNPNSRHERFLHSAIESLLNNYMSPSGLFRHYGCRKARARFPNFATQIYCILALATSSKVLNKKKILPAATQAADKLLALQLSDGGWPWLFDAKKGTVVERYEVYSVHQDGMAPMALFELFEATGKRDYVESACKGLNWIYGNNELHYHMLRKDSGLIYRSIRRKKPFDRLFLYSNLILSMVKKGDFFPGYPLEINDTCRPYHFGWILEAWCGREKLFK